MTDSFCDYFKVCGGCRLQDTPYSRQLEKKKRALEGFAGKSVDLVVGSETQGYRCRLDMTFNGSGIGFRRIGTWDRMIDVKRCPIATDELNKLIKEIREHFREPDYFDLISTEGTLRYCVVRAPTGASSIGFVLNPKSAGVEKEVENIRSFAQGCSCENIAVAFVAAPADESISDDYFMVKGSEWLNTTLLGRRFDFHMQGFFQNNLQVFEKLLAYTKQKFSTSDCSGKTLMDLYGGVGSFGLSLTDMYREVLIVENAPVSIMGAERNILENKISNAKALLIDAKKVGTLAVEGPVDVVCDPTRGGMGKKIIRKILRLDPERIIYVSCNPRMLELELQHFDGYELESLALFDMFPHTEHMEAVLEFKRQDLAGKKL